MSLTTTEILSFCLLVFTKQIEAEQLKYDTWRGRHDNKHFYHAVSVKYTLRHQRCGSCLVITCSCSCFRAEATFQISSCSKATRHQRNLINRQWAHVCPHFLFPGNCKSISWNKTKQYMTGSLFKLCNKHEPFRPSQHIKREQHSSSRCGKPTASRQLISCVCHMNHCQLPRLFVYPESYNFYFSLPVQLLLIHSTLLKVQQIRILTLAVSWCFKLMKPC